MEYYPFRRSRFHCHENFCLIYMDLKSPLEDINFPKCVVKLSSEIISISMYSETLFGSISILFLREFILI